MQVWNVPFFLFSPLNFLKHTSAPVGRKQSAIHGSANVSSYHTTWALSGFLANCLWVPNQVSLLCTHYLLYLTFHVCAGLDPNYETYIVNVVSLTFKLISLWKRKMSFGFYKWVVQQESMRTFPCHNIPRGSRGYDDEVLILPS